MKWRWRHALIKTNGAQLNPFTILTVKVTQTPHVLESTAP